MFLYQLKTAVRSIRRNPILSTLLVLGIALGIAVSTAFVTTYYLLSRNPIPDKSDVLYYVQLDAWNPDRPWDDENPEEPPDQVTWRDMQAVMQSDIPTYKSGMYKAQLTVHPEDEDERPFRALTRMCYSDFFPMFDVPFLYGSGWGPSADQGPEPVVVLRKDTNERLFGGENSVGRKLRIEDRDFTVVGVLDDWKPSPKFYDVTNFEFDEVEELFMPIEFSRPMEVDSAGNDSGWKFEGGDTYDDWLQSESIWLQLWVQLDTREQKDEFQAFLDAYALDQRALGRFQRPINNRLRDVMTWMDTEEVVPEEAINFVIIGILFLVVCSVNLIGLLLGKFLARGPEVGVRRALGASRASVFVQHLVECELIGVIGGILGLGLSVLTLEFINKLFAEADLEFALDLNMVGAGVLLSLIAGLIAGLYPAWRICRIQPAMHLKTQ
jgi:putative ABC transport system permease protein